MTTWIALLRGINVGGNNILPMKDLTMMLENMGCTGVKTYIQSGNVVFSNAGSKAPQLAKAIGQSVLSSHGFEPNVQVLTADELEYAAKSNPFPNAVADPKSLHVSFLNAEPKAPDEKMLGEIKSKTESYVLKGKLFYLHAPDGIGRSKLAAKAEKLLGVEATGRNWRTVSKLLDLTRE